MDIDYLNGKRAKVVVKENFISTNVYSRVFTSSHDGSLTPIRKAAVTWQTGGPLAWGKKKSLHLEKMVIKVMSIWNPRDRKLFATTLCSDDEVLEAGKTVTFTPCIDG